MKVNVNIQHILREYNYFDIIYQFISLFIFSVKKSKTHLYLYVNNILC